MKTKLNRWIPVFLAALFVAAFALFPAQASAAQAGDPVSNSCLSCHEDLYYLYDTGKWYCITEHRDRCVNCHDGNAATTNKEESHQGLIFHPQRNNGEKCLECHPQDSQTRLTRFASVAGFGEVVESAPRQPVEQVALGAPHTDESNRLVEGLPWAVGGIVAFGLWLALVLLSPTKP
jgi:hypothetical protein